MNMMEKDPVCGMDVDPKTASAKSDYQGRTYYFCSMEDKETFDEEPQRYAKSSMEHDGPQMGNW
jgi:YHS domain-containing protein